MALRYQSAVASIEPSDRRFSSASSRASSAARCQLDEALHGRVDLADLEPRDGAVGQRDGLAGPVADGVLLTDQLVEQRHGRTAVALFGQANGLPLHCEAKQLRVFYLPRQGQGLGALSQRLVRHMPNSICLVTRPSWRFDLVSPASLVSGRWRLERVGLGPVRLLLGPDCCRGRLDCLLTSLQLLPIESLDWQQYVSRNR